MPTYGDWTFDGPTDHLDKRVQAVVLGSLCLTGEFVEIDGVRVFVSDSGRHYGMSRVEKWREIKQ